MDNDQKIKPRRKPRVGVWCAVITAAAAGTALAVEQVAVNVSAIEIFAKKSGMAKVVAQAPKGAQLQVLATEGEWLKVRDPAGQEGFVKKEGLNKPTLSAGNRPVGGTAGTNGVTASLATHGALEEAAQKYATQQRISQSAVDGLNHQFDLRNSITPEQLDQFQAGK